MKKMNIFRNLLITNILPPPISSGKVIPCLFFSFSLPVLAALTGCESDMVRYDEIRQYHQESKTLQQVESDSVNRFTQKVDAFVVVHADAVDDPLYPEIRQNIEDALVKFVITVQDEWDKEDISY